MNNSIKEKNTLTTNVGMINFQVLQLQNHIER